MARRCSLTNKAVLSGNKVSHSNRKTKKRFLPNLKYKILLSDTLGTIRLRICTRALKSIEIKGGLDNYLLSKSNCKLPQDALKIKNLIKKQLAKIQLSAA